MLIDTHCHLDDDRLFCEAADIIRNMQNDGLYAVISSSSDYNSSVRNYSLARKNDAVYATVGIHPHEVKDATNNQYDEIIKMAADGKVAAIGEIGLDYYYDLSPRELQKSELCRQLELADYVKLPVVFHVRDAYEDFYKIVRENKRYLNHGAAVHCYSGSAEFMEQLKEFDFYYGFDGPLTYKNARHSVESVLAAKIDRILVETDAPYLAPLPVRGQTNYPKYVRYTASKAAEILNIPFEKFSDITTKNAKTLFEKII